MRVGAFAPPVTGKRWPFFPGSALEVEPLYLFTSVELQSLRQNELKSDVARFTIHE